MITFVEHYYKRNDLSHQLDHAIEVLNRAIMFKKYFNLDVLDAEIIAAALLHDVQLYLGRSNHHEAGAIFATNEQYPGKADMSLESQRRVASAIREHRASYAGKYSSTLSELISSADRDVPDENSVGILMTRCLKCRTGSDAKQDAIEYLKNKYGTNGYARYPQMYESFYGKMILNRSKAIDMLIE
jgi:exopolyphosphatase/pppGpp-phosphohydrolase